MGVLSYADRHHRLMDGPLSDLYGLTDEQALAVLAHRLHPNAAEEDLPPIPVLDEDGNIVRYEGGWSSPPEHKDIAAGAPGMGAHPVNRGISTVIASEDNTTAKQRRKRRKLRRLAYRRRPS